MFGGASDKQTKKLQKSTLSRIIKSGYLTKRAKSGKASYSKRYFALSESTLTYFLDHKHTDIPKGDLMLDEGCKVIVPEESVFDFGLEVQTNNESLLLGCADEKEQADWKEKIERAVGNIQGRCRGVLWKGGRFGRESSWFFMLHSDGITYHTNQHKTSQILGLRKFSKKTTVESLENNYFVIKTNLRDQKVWKLRAKTTEECDNWVTCIQDVVSKLGFCEIDYLDKSADQLSTDCMKSGFLSIRPKQGGTDWLDRYYILKENKVYQFQDSDSVQPANIYVLSPNCSVFETKLKKDSFELVTNSRVLHFQGASTDDTKAWITVLRQAIGESKHEQMDPLLEAAKKQKNVFYDVTFETKKPLGLVLERSANWALVKIANQDSTHVTVGSALNTVNDDSVVLNDYNDTIKLLTAWSPPLKLGFRLAPEKKGWVTKQGRGRKTKRKNWKPRYFVLAEGRLSYYSDSGPDAELKGVVHLMGSAVSLVPRSETGQYFCFKIVSGITGIVMQGLTVDDMMEWAVTIYHAIAVANGGGFILDVERENQSTRIKEEKAKAEMREKEVELQFAQDEHVKSLAIVEKAVEEEEEAKLFREELEKNGGGEENILSAKKAEEKAGANARIAFAKQQSCRLEVDEIKEYVENIGSEIAALEFEGGETGANAARDEVEGRTVDLEDEGIATTANGEEGDDQLIGEEEDEPTEWQAYWNVTHCVWYYYNIHTNETSWERPLGVEITVNQPEVWEPTEDDEGNTVPEGTRKKTMSLAMSMEVMEREVSLCKTSRGKSSFGGVSESGEVWESGDNDVEADETYAEPEEPEVREVVGSEVRTETEAGVEVEVNAADIEVEIDAIGAEVGTDVDAAGGAEYGTEYEAEYGDEVGTVETEAGSETGAGAEVVQEEQIMTPSPSVPFAEDTETPTPPSSASRSPGVSFSTESSGGESLPHVPPQSSPGASDLDNGRESSLSLGIEKQPSMPKTAFHPPSLHTEQSTIIRTNQINDAFGLDRTQSGMIRPEPPTDYLRAALDRNKSTREGLTTGEEGELVAADAASNRRASRRRSTVPIVPPPITLPPQLEEELGGDESDEEEGLGAVGEMGSTPPSNIMLPVGLMAEMSLRTLNKSIPKRRGDANDDEDDDDEEEMEGGVRREQHVLKGQYQQYLLTTDTHDDAHIPSLTDEQLTAIFETVDHGANKGNLNPMLFGTLIRAVTSNSLQLYDEMNFFAKFNTSGDGVIDLGEWINGVRTHEKEHGRNELFYKGLINYHESAAFTL